MADIDIKIVWKGDEVKADIKSVSAKALRNAAEFILLQSNQNIPVDEGTLKNSGNTFVDDDALEASVYYDTPYAVRQHEDMTIRHKNGRSAKYLENAYKNNIKQIQDYIADAIRTGVR